MVTSAVVVNPQPDLTPTVDLGRVTNPVMAATAWQTNADLIVDLARLRYLSRTDRIVDVTYGQGVFWRKWRPTGPGGVLITRSSDDEPGFDFRHLDYRDCSFDVAVFDPPYVAPGGRDTSTLPMNAQYGMLQAAKTPVENHRVNMEGLAECHRVVRPGGLVITKCMDYVSSGRLQPVTLWTANYAISVLRMDLVDRLEHLGRPRQQPQRSRQDGVPVRQHHARRNLSTLLVFRRTARLPHQTDVKVDPDGPV